MCPSNTMRSRAASGLFGRSRGPASGRTSVTAVVALLVASTWLMTVVVLVLGPGGGHDASIAISDSVVTGWAAVSGWSTQTSENPSSGQVGEFLAFNRSHGKEASGESKKGAQSTLLDENEIGTANERIEKITGGGAQGGENAPPRGRSGTVTAEPTHEDAPPGARRSGRTSTERRQRQPKVVLISWKPRVAFLHDFLNDTECDRLIELGKGALARSETVLPDGKPGVDQARTSSGSFLTGELQWDPIVRAVEDRIAKYTFQPVENGEAMQILRYENGQFYKPHYDLFAEELMRFQPGGNRIATVIMYLSDVEEGGETLFPNARLPGMKTSSALCGGVCSHGVSVAPKKGSAVLFWSKSPDGRPDPDSLHAGCTVLKGEKWSATKWIRERCLC